MQASEIKELMDKATKGPWEAWEDAGFIVIGEKDKQGLEIFTIDFYAKDTEEDIEAKRKLAEYLASLPDIAQTALDALARVEEATKDIHRAVELAYVETGESEQGDPTKAIEAEKELDSLLAKYVL